MSERASGSKCTACGASYRSVIAICPNCSAAITPELPEIRIGCIFDGKYEIVSLLGAGGMGEVFKARHIHLNHFRTIKSMRKNLLTDEASRKRFSREARVATRVHHRNVAVVHDFSIAPDGSDYIVSEYVNGVTIRQWAAQPRPFSLAITIDIALQVLAGLQHLHTAGILHRDLSPDNIMIATDDDGQPTVKIIDLGLAKILTESTPAHDSTTKSGLFLGNPRYSSPEQLGGEQIDARSDLYSFGVVLYEMLTGVTPFIAATPQGYAVKHLTEAPPPLIVRPGLGAWPAGLESVVAKALQKNRDLRHASAKELAEELEPFRHASIPPAAIEAPPPPPRPPEPSQPVEPVYDAAFTSPAPSGPSVPSALPVAAEPWRLPVWITAGVAVGMVLAVTATVAYTRRQEPVSENASAPTPAPARPAPIVVTAVPPVVSEPLVVRGEIVIDANPWARIGSVHDGNKEWISNTALYTPQRLKVPVGNYTVELFGPDGTRQSFVAGVVSHEPAVVRGDFHTCDGCTANSRP